MLVKLVILTTLLTVFNTSANVSRRRYGKPPSGYGSNAEYHPSQFGQEPGYRYFGQYPSFPSQNANQMEYGGLPQQQYPEEDDDGDIQQVSRDTEDFGFLKKPNQKQNEIVDEPPPKYTQASESSEIIEQGSQNQVRGQTRPEATTPKGTFIGKKETVDGKDVYAFYGVRYAKPPVGNNRFRRPEPSDKLEEPYEATHLPDACSQVVAEAFPDFAGEKMWNPNTNISEDCLFLNIWVPATVFEEKEEKLVPVLNWLYGGGFFSGSASLDVYNGAVLAATENLIVVNIQYRLGPFGFLYFGNDDAPGNMGLLDQALGLQWVRENIEYFGGNPNAVTLAGESCGAASVGFHLVSPISKNYFKRAILTSGLPTMFYALKYPDDLKSRSYLLAKHAGCNQKSCDKIIECLRKVDHNKLSSLQWKLFKNMLDFPFGPTMDGYFLPDHPENIIRKGKAKRTEVILGTVRDEGTYFILYHYVNYFSHVKPTNVPYDRFVEIMEELFHDHSENERELILNQYTNWENPEDGYANQRQIGNAVGDAFFVCPQRKFADEWSNRGLPVYYYHFTERSKMNPWAEWMGVMHGDDVPLFFGEAVKEPSYPDAEKQMSVNFMDMIGSFARTGVPSPTWERYTSEHPVYLEVNATTITKTSTPDLHGPRANHCPLWNKIVPLLHYANEECRRNEDENNLNKLSMQQPQHNFPSHPFHQCGITGTQWNPQGQGIHGGQGFQTNNLQGHPPGMNGGSFQQQTPCSFPSHEQTQGFGHGSSPQQYPSSNKPISNFNSNFACDSRSPSYDSPPKLPPPTATSCECTVSEKASGFGEQTSGKPEDVTPPPAVE